MFFIVRINKNWITDILPQKIVRNHCTVYVQSSKKITESQAKSSANRNLSDSYTHIMCDG